MEKIDVYTLDPSFNNLVFLNKSKNYYQVLKTCSESHLNEFANLSATYYETAFSELRGEYPYINPDNSKEYLKKHNNFYLCGYSFSVENRCKTQQEYMKYFLETFVKVSNELKINDVYVATRMFKLLDGMLFWELLCITPRKNVFSLDFDNINIIKFDKSIVNINSFPTNAWWNSHKLRTNKIFDLGNF